MRLSWYQNAKDKSGFQNQIQQLQLQQQQIVQQIQLIQRQYLLANGLVGLPGFPPPGQGKFIWKLFHVNICSFTSNPQWSW